MGLKVHEDGIKMTSTKNCHSEHIVDVRHCHSCFKQVDV